MNEPMPLLPQELDFRCSKCGEKNPQCAVSIGLDRYTSDAVLRFHVPEGVHLRWTNAEAHREAQWFYPHYVPNGLEISGVCGPVLPVGRRGEEPDAAPTIALETLRAFVLRGLEATLERPLAERVFWAVEKCLGAAWWVNEIAAYYRNVLYTSGVLKRAASGERYPEDPPLAELGEALWRFATGSHAQRVFWLTKTRAIEVPPPESVPCPACGRQMARREAFYQCPNCLTTSGCF